ncbi:uncharacterized protein DNG_04630 [Cephalotrichum gorgonifer]|uniref:Uncharacterized protein n=1 Tax=Cephalotrichum gorgonifer TaxID=2041049 RepID=A0AAE8MWR2_9PEZI|nr:uncharacterized protein DNG_04630 [Cephalotrichum gorgonifer]
MVMNTALGRVALACGALAPAVLAQQTTVQGWIPYVGGGPDEAEFYASATLDVKTTIGNAVVAVVKMPDEFGEEGSDAYNPEFTIGPNTFHIDWTYTYTETDEATTTLSVASEMYDCTFSGCPVATAGSCTFAGGSSDDDDDDDDGPRSGTYVLASTDLHFYPLTLATPLPTALPDSCSGDNENSGDSEATPTKTTGSEDQAAASDSPNGGWRASVSLFGLISGAVLALAI